MSTDIRSKRPHFDNLSYVSDGRDRISYISDPYAASLHTTNVVDSRGLVLQPKELNRARQQPNTVYTFRSGQENLYAYNNAAFRWDRRFTCRSTLIVSLCLSFQWYQRCWFTWTLHTISKSQCLCLPEFFRETDPSTKRFVVAAWFTHTVSFSSLGHLVVRLCSRYWYIVLLLVLVILAAIGFGIGFAVVRSRNKGRLIVHFLTIEPIPFVAGCSSSCGPSERLIHINSTYCECQCKFDLVEYFSSLSFPSID